MRDALWDYQIKIFNPYSVDLRWRVIWLYTAQQLSCSEISELLCVSQRSVQRFIARFEQTGDVQPLPHRHGPPMLFGDFEQAFLLHLILEYPGIYLDEIQDRILAMSGVSVSTSTICRTLKYIGRLYNTLLFSVVMNEELNLWPRFLLMTHQCSFG